MAGIQSSGKAKGLSSAGLSLTRASESLWTDYWDHQQSEDGQEMWTGLPGKREMGKQTTSLLLLGGWMLSVPEKSSIREWKSLGFMMFMLSGQHCFLPRTLPQIHMNPCFGHIPMSRIFVSRFLYPLKFPKGKLLAIILILVLPKNGLATCPR